jgi:hypothetical protein
MTSTVTSAMTNAATSAFPAVAQVLNNDTVSPGLLGLGVVAALGVATWLLIRSMNRQLRKIDFDESNQPSNADKADGTDARATPAEPAKPDKQAKAPKTDEPPRRGG